MPISNLAKVEKSLAGCWRLPPGPDFDSCVTLLPNKSLEWTETPTSFKRGVRTIITGEKMTGTWSIRAKRPTPALDRVRQMMRDSSTYLPDSSLRVMPKSMMDFVNYDLETDTIKNPPEANPGQRAIQPATVSHPPALWWLVLKVTNFPQSFANLNIMGTKVDTVDWIHNLKELFSDHAHAVLAYDNGETLQLRLPDGKIQTWERVSRFFMDMEDEHL